MNQNVKHSEEARRDVRVLSALAILECLIGVVIGVHVVQGNGPLYHASLVDSWLGALSAAWLRDASRFTKHNRPQRVILVRHGQSVGNANMHIYQYVPDNKLPLTNRGFEQAQEAGKKLRELVGNETALFFVSPYVRARQTLRAILVGGKFNAKNFSVREDPRLREQEFGNFQDPCLSEQLSEMRNEVGRFWYRMDNGESGADVFDRVTSFLETLHREIDGHRRNPKLDNVVIVSHGLAIRLFCMRYLHWTVQEFEKVWNPHNGEIWVMEKNGSGRYELVTPITIGANRKDLMPLSMRVPHRDAGEDLETYLHNVKGHYESSPLLDGIVMDPKSMAALDPCELGSMTQMKDYAESEAKKLRHVGDLANDSDTSEEDQEDSAFTRHINGSTPCSSSHNRSLGDLRVGMPEASPTREGT